LTPEKYGISIKATTFSSPKTSSTGKEEVGDPAVPTESPVEQPVEAVAEAIHGGELTHL